MSICAPENVELARRHLRNENHRWPSRLVKMPPAKWPPNLPARIAEVWRSKCFLVQVFHEPGAIVRLTVARTWINNAGDYEDGICWDELQQIKREVGYGDRDAVEVFPADRDVVNVANMRHLWVMPEPLTFKWCALRAAKETQ